MFDRWIEETGLVDVLADEGIGCIGFSPLCQGILTNKYIDEIPEGSRATKLEGQFHWGDSVTEERLAKVRKLNEIAKARGQNMAQMAIAWTLRLEVMTSALIGASRPAQIEDAVKALDNLEFSAEELDAIEAILAG
jgi:L-glyceraldehyde 3-phosphate reductase